MSKEIVFDQEAHKKTALGISKLAKAVSSTLGPSGQYVMIQNPRGYPIITNDGVTVAKHIQLDDPFENMGAKLAIEVASKTNDEAGDGTTTATVIADSIIEHALRRINSGNKNQAIRSGIEKATDIAVKSIRELSKEVNTTDELESVATISASHDADIGKLMTEAMETVGPKGIISIEEGKAMQTDLVYTEGLALGSGYLSPHFANPQDLKCKMDKPFVVVIDGAINTTKDILQALEIANAASRPLLIIADSISNEILTLLVINKLQANLNVVAINNPAAGAARQGVLEDIAVSVGATLFSAASVKNISEIEIDDLGEAKNIIVLADSTTIFEGAADKDAFDKHVATVKGLADNAQTDREVEMYMTRHAMLTSSIAKISVGGCTESEIKEKMFRVEDSLNATRAAKLEGIVPGGGAAYLVASKAIRDSKDFTTDEQLGADILADALEQPMRKIAGNAGYEGAEVVAEAKRGAKNFGFNAITGKHEDLMKSGIIDPTRVACSAVVNAASIAKLIISTDTLVAENFDNESKVVR